MDKRNLVRYVVWRHLLGWLLALAVLAAVFFVETGEGPGSMILLVVAFALLVATPVLYFLAKRTIPDRER